MPRCWFFSVFFLVWSSNKACVEFIISAKKDNTHFSSFVLFFSFSYSKWSKHPLHSPGRNWTGPAQYLSPEAAATKGPFRALISIYRWGVSSKSVFMGGRCVFAQLESWEGRSHTSLAAWELSFIPKSEFKIFLQAKIDSWRVALDGSITEVCPVNSRLALHGWWQAWWEVGLRPLLAQLFYPASRMTCHRGLA